ncbi:MAG: NADP-dependent phosphogluconate dehydrogenase [Cephaloticoccus sp.]|nr:NADP-dependent phosphogluconate dehydrogenase [Cephaloticoccus sp.]
MAKELSDIGLIGLAVMGQNLALNIADHGFQISVYNRTTEKTDKFVAENPSTPGGLVGTKTLEEFVASLARPRKAIILVQAGRPTDAVIDGLAALFEPGDIIIDGGNALWTDTIRREKALKEKGLLFIGSGVSGGEEGARFGPSLMPGGDKTAFKHLEKIWKAVAAKVDKKTGKPILGAQPGKPVKGGVPCTAYIGENGAGHYVKMVHNGIYGDMQMICEAYDLMKGLLGLKPAEMGDIFSTWNKGALDSFLIEITADILKQKDPASKKPFVDVVLDTAGQKGTGKWTSVNALDMGVAAPTIAESVFSRCLSAIKEERVAASKVLKGPKVKKISPAKKKELIQAIHDALYCSKICSYAQGFQLMRQAQVEFNWKLNFGQIAQIWRGGCIIRAAFLQKITEAYKQNPKLANLLLDPYFNKTIQKAQANWRKVVSLAAENGIPVPTFASSLAYYDGYRSARLPANLLQAQRDYFGAHTYERVDQKRGKFYHIDWPEPSRPQLEA